MDVGDSYYCNCGVEMIEDSDHQMRLQIEMAASGCISGTGAEWSHLVHALRYYGFKAKSNMDAIRLRIAALEICRKQGWLR